MVLFDYLINTYGCNEPIVSTEISFNDYSRPWIRKEISKLCEVGKLSRFEKGIYYIPTDTIQGKSKLDVEKVITKKYIYDGNAIIGYYSGLALMNSIGLSDQIPDTLEIYTNMEQSRARVVVVGEQKVLLRHSRTSINDNNVATMRLLELMNFTAADFYDDEKKNIIIEYISRNEITRKDISNNAPFFPDKAMRTLVESEIVYSITR